MNIEQTWQLLELMPDAVVVMGGAGKIAFANQQAAILLGYTPDELIGEPHEMIVPRRFRAELAERSKAYLAKPAVRPMNSNLELWALRKDGQEVPVDISLSPFDVSDEIHVVATIRDISHRKQTKLLRIIQEGEFERVGCSKTRSVNVRIVAATNRDLPVEIQQGRLRPDLYFRLAVFPIQVPTLRARKEDIPLLVWYFVAKKQPKLGKKITEISDATMDRLVEYPWPGNIRELENVIERAIILSTDSSLMVEPLLDVIKQSTGVIEATSAHAESIDSMIRDHIVRVLKECHWQIKGASGAAERLGINSSTLRYRMKKLGIKRP